MTKKIPVELPDKPYDRARIDRFVRLVQDRKEADWSAIAAAAQLLDDLLDDIQAQRHLQKRFTAIGYRKNYGVTPDREPFSPERADLNGPEIEIARQQLDGEIEYKQALAELTKLHPNEGRQAENWLAVLKDRVRRSFQGLFWREAHVSVRKSGRGE